MKAGRRRGASSVADAGFMREAWPGADVVVAAELETAGWDSCLRCVVVMGGFARVTGGRLVAELDVPEDAAEGGLSTVEEVSAVAEDFALECPMARGLAVDPAGRPPEVVGRDAGARVEAVVTDGARLGRAVKLFLVAVSAWSCAAAGFACLTDGARPRIPDIGLLFVPGAAVLAGGGGGLALPALVDGFTGNLLGDAFRSPPGAGADDVVASLSLRDLTAASAPPIGGAGFRSERDLPRVVEDDMSCLCLWAGGVSSLDKVHSCL